MRIVTISDTHTLHEGIVLPDGDLLVQAGDFSLGGQPHRNKFGSWELGLRRPTPNP